MSDLTMPSAFKHTSRKASKEHVCCECRKEIKRGDEYDFISGIWDGRPESYKICMSCAKIRDDYHDKTGEEAGFGMLKEVISDCCFYKNYGAKEYIEDYPELKQELERLLLS